MKEWLNSVNRMALLNGVGDFRFSEKVIEALAYAYHKNFTPIEAMAFLRLVANKIGDDNPDKMREIEARARKLVLLAKCDAGYNADLVRQHIARFIDIATLRERRPEPRRSTRHTARFSDPLNMT